VSPTTLLFHNRSLSADTQSIRFSIARVKRSEHAPFMKLSKQSVGNIVALEAALMLVYTGSRHWRRDGSVAKFEFDTSSIG
jgi:hypothetical protein